MTENIGEFSEEEEKAVRHAMGLIMECMILNKIASRDGVHAMINIISTQLQDKHKEKFTKFLEEMASDR